MPNGIITLHTMNATPTARPANTVLACTCGHATTHRIAQRSTSDGITVVLYSDGAIAGRFHALRGVRMAKPRTVEARRLALTVGWMFLGEVELYDADELGALYGACRWAAERGLDRVAMLSRLNREAPIQFVWETLETDRDGNVRERVCRLNRLMWPGLAVWNGRRGDYEVMTDYDSGRGRDVLVPTGMRFATIRELCTYLRSIRIRFSVKEAS